MKPIFLLAGVVAYPLDAGSVDAGSVPVTLVDVRLAVATLEPSGADAGVVCNQVLTVSAIITGAVRAVVRQPVGVNSALVNVNLTVVTCLKSEICVVSLKNPSLLTSISPHR